MHQSFLSHIEVCKILLNAGADINAFDNEGNTPLMKAAGKGIQSDEELKEIF